MKRTSYTRVIKRAVQFTSCEDDVRRAPCLYCARFLQPKSWDKVEVSVPCVYCRETHYDRTVYAAVCKNCTEPPRGYPQRTVA